MVNALVTIPTLYKLDDITAIVTVSDYGEQRSKSKQDLGTLPLDDVKGSYVALAANENEMDCLMNLTFKNPKLEGLKMVSKGCASSA